MDTRQRDTIHYSQAKKIPRPVGWGIAIRVHLPPHFSKGAGCFRTAPEIFLKIPLKNPIAPSGFPSMQSEAG